MRTKSFNDVIADSLKQRAAEDRLFAPKLENPRKSIDECCRYITGEARKRGNAVFMSDDEVFGLAIHYYDEDNVQIAYSGKCRVSTDNQDDKSQKESNQLSIPYTRPPVTQYRRTKVKREENKLQLSLFD